MDDAMYVSAQPLPESPTSGYPSPGRPRLQEESRIDQPVNGSNPSVRQSRDPMPPPLPMKTSARTHNTAATLRHRLSSTDSEGYHGSKAPPERRRGTESSSGISSASSESDSEIPHDLPSAPCTINPPSLCVEEAANIHVDLPSCNGIYLTQSRCTLWFVGRQSGRRTQVEGKRRNHNYGIMALSPVWVWPEKVEIYILTLEGQVLGWGSFEFLPRQSMPSTSISFNLRASGDWRAPEFFRAVRSSCLTNSLSSHPTLSYPAAVSTFSFLLCFSESSDVVTNLLDTVIAFALTNGIPEGISLVEMFSNIPDLQKALESSHYAEGSLHHLMDVIHSQSRHDDTVEQFKELIEKATGAECEYVEMSAVRKEDDPTPLTASEDRIYDDPHELIPSYTGLELPHNVASSISSEYGRKMMVSVRDGTMSRHKAIEMVRDEVKMSNRSAPTSPRQQPNLRHRNLRSQSVFYAPFDADEAASSQMSTCDDQVSYISEPKRDLRRHHSDLAIGRNRGRSWPSSSSQPPNQGNTVNSKDYSRAISCRAPLTITRSFDCGQSEHDYLIMGPSYPSERTNTRESNGSRNRKPVPPRREASNPSWGKQAVQNKQ